MEKHLGTNGYTALTEGNPSALICFSRHCACGDLWVYSYISDSWQEFKSPFKAALLMIQLNNHYSIFMTFKASFQTPYIYFSLES